MGSGHKPIVSDFIAVGSGTISDSQNRKINHDRLQMNDSRVLNEQLSVNESSTVKGSAALIWRTYHGFRIIKRHHALE